jgi:hypothetical protein
VLVAPRDTSNVWIEFRTQSSATNR